MTSLLDYLRLCRASNVLTAVSNVLAGYLLAVGSWSPVLPLLILVLASCHFYLAGMVLNDVFDVERDKRERPERPLPSGKITVRTAHRLGFGLLAGGFLLSLMAGLAGDGEVLKQGLSLKTGLTAVLLTTFILVYDSGAKFTVAGPLIMGSCRTLNVLLGCSLAKPQTGNWLGFEPICWAAAAGIGIYVAGITIFASQESRKSQKIRLTTGMLTSVLGAALLVSMPFWVTRNPALDALSDNARFVYCITMSLIFLVVVRRMLTAIASQAPHRVQAAVIVSLMTLIMIDAGICFLAVPSKLFYSFSVALMIIPTLLLGRWINPT